MRWPTHTEEPEDKNNPKGVHGGCAPSDRNTASETTCSRGRSPGDVGACLLIGVKSQRLEPLGCDKPRSAVWFSWASLVWPLMQYGHWVSAKMRAGGAFAHSTLGSGSRDFAELGQSGLGAPANPGHSNVEGPRKVS